MLRKQITYKNPFDGTEVTETHYFHLTEADIVELDMVHKDGLIPYLISGIANEDKALVFSELKKMILKAYGKRQGSKFLQNQQLRDEFLSTGAYSALFIELLRDTTALSAFVNGIASGTMTTTSLSAVPDSGEPRKVYSRDLLDLSQEDMIQLGEDIVAGKVVLVPDVPENETDTPDDLKKLREEAKHGEISPSA